MNAVLLLLLLGQKFYPDDPIKEDRDDLPIERPADIELSPTYDFLSNTFAPPEIEAPIPRAMNANTLGEVPDSTWFTNRIGVRDIHPEELARGPHDGGPPDVSQPLTIISAKRDGITPGFTMRDSRGHVYFVKFDPKPYPSLSTGADMISKNFFHAIGYNVPEAYIVHVRAENFVIHADAMVRLRGGKEAPMDRDYLELMLDGAAGDPDGAVRALASLRVPGEILGPFRFYGSRSDDPNDIFPHQHRRELRGYRVFCAWLNHDDSRSINTLDTFSSQHVRHYLIDFGSTLGSGSDVSRNIAPQDPRAGNEYLIDLSQAWKTAYTFGLVDPRWRRIRYLYPEYAEAGRIEAEHFDPAAWKPEYPNPAFDRMLPDDSFWAAKIVNRFSDDAIRAIVKAGEYRSAATEQYLADTLIKRRDKIVSYYFSLVNPLDGFTVTDSRLEFDHLGDHAPDEYRYQWFVFDNEKSKLERLGGEVGNRGPSVAVPDVEVPYLMVRIRADEGSKAVEVYLRREASGYEVVGIDREI